MYSIKGKKPTLHTTPTSNSQTSTPDLKTQVSGISNPKKLIPENLVFINQNHTKSKQNKTKTKIPEFVISILNLVELQFGPFQYKKLFYRNIKIFCDPY